MTTKTEKPAAKKGREDHVYETAGNTTAHNPYDLKVGGKPACTLADGTTPETVTATSSKAE